MELTLEQQTAVQRGEVIPLHVPHVEGECVIMLRDQYNDLQERLQEDDAMAAVRAEIAKKLPPERLRQLAKQYQPDPSWYEEDHTDLYDVPAS